MMPLEHQADNDTKQSSGGSCWTCRGAQSSTPCEYPEPGVAAESGDDTPQVPPGQWASGYGGPREGDRGLRSSASLTWDFAVVVTKDCACGVDDVLPGRSNVGMGGRSRPTGGCNLSGCDLQPSRLSRECPECAQGRFQRSSQHAGCASETEEMSGARDWSRTSPGVRPECRGKRQPTSARNSTERWWRQRESNLCLDILLAWRGESDSRFQYSAPEPKLRRDESGANPNRPTRQQRQMPTAASSKRAPSATRPPLRARYESGWM